MCHNHCLVTALIQVCWKFPFFCPCLSRLSFPWSPLSIVVLVVNHSEWCAGPNIKIDKPYAGQPACHNLNTPSPPAVSVDRNAYFTCPWMRCMLGAASVSFSIEYALTRPHIHSILQGHQGGSVWASNAVCHNWIVSLLIYSQLPLYLPSYEPVHADVFILRIQWLYGNKLMLNEWCLVNYEFPSFALYIFLSKGIPYISRSKIA